MEGKKTILIVDDEAVIGMNVAQILEKYNYNTIYLPSGNEAIKLLKEGKKIDMVLMDIDLGNGLSGKETAEFILSNYEIPVVFLTSHTEKEVIEETEGISSYGYIVKTFGEPLMLAMIKMAFRLFETQMREKKALENLKESEKTFRLIFEHSPIGTYVALPDGTITDVNPSLLKTLGSPGADKTKEINLLTFPLLIKVGFSENFKKCVNEKRIVYMDFEYTSKWGKFSIMETYFVPILDDNGNVEKVLGLVQDVTAKREAEKNIKKLLEEKELLLKEVHHRVKNNIVSIVSLMNLQKRTAKSEETISILNDMIGRIESMGILYEKLMSTNLYREISIKQYTEELIDRIADVFSNQQKILITNDIQDFYINSKKAFYLGMMINEILTNILKHAFKGREKGKVDIVIKKDEKVILKIKDDGIGLPEDFDINTNEGFGIMLIRLLVQQLEGEISFKSTPGAGSEVIFKFLP